MLNSEAAVVTLAFKRESMLVGSYTASVTTTVATPFMYPDAGSGVATDKEWLTSVRQVILST